MGVLAQFPEYDEAHSTVAGDLLARILARPPKFLERLTLKLLVSMGYGGLEAATEHLGGPGDQGLDGLIRQDLLGLDVVYVHAKRYATDRKIGRPDIQGFVGALHGAQASRGIFITTSSFSADARIYAERVNARAGSWLLRLAVPAQSEASRWDGVLRALPLLRRRQNPSLWLDHQLWPPHL